MKKDEIENCAKEIKENVSGSINLGRDASDEDVKELITGIVFNKTRNGLAGVSERQALVEWVFNSMRRLDILQPLIDDPDVTEIMVNGPGDIFTEREGKVSRLDLRFESREKLEDVIQSIVSRANRTVNESSPIVDARLQDGSRVNVVLAPIALNGPIMTIRKFPEKPMTMQRLVELGSITGEAAEALKLLVRAKYNIFICGGTGSGKTSFLNALSAFIPPDERVVTIEDSAELQIKDIENIVRMETRNANTEGRGQITIRDLIRTSLRMRPERIIVGEVRGEEALDMLQAMNTGHDGSLSTGHANSAEDILSRLETMVLAAAPLPLEAIRQQIASALDVIIHLSRMRDKSRRTVEIAEVVGCADGKISLNPLFVFEDRGETEGGKVNGSLVRTENPLVNTVKFKMAGINCSL
jgi:pilus assembly protein CpaF